MPCSVDITGRPALVLNGNGGVDLGRGDMGRRTGRSGRSGECGQDVL